MLWKKKLWSTLVVCLGVSLWNIYKLVNTGPSTSSHHFEEQPMMEGKSCNCNRCTELSNLDWFCERFDTSVNCLLTLENSEIPSGVLQWWLKLQRSNDGSQLQEIIKDLFDILPSPATGVEDIVQCGTCAVVGNSGRLRGSKYGEKIDSHNFVLRMNTAQTAGFEEDVGARTTHHFMYPESAMNLGPDIHLVLVPFKPLDLKWLASAFSSGEIWRTYRRVKPFLKADKSKVLILNPVFLKYIQDKWTMHYGRYPSTGFITLIFAIHTCTQTTMGTGITTGKRTELLEHSAGLECMMPSLNYNSLKG
ncbi:CMP-N-acetylneuraminate-beta-galactosamide-alpha-2,3-sialyltransferase 2-like isoform X2 [Hemicordylus capensis]|uniref:CMP-N-acetylneuraminate-beta-galactosamide- alpha-2,3-sialyltransferase 2-like isoform X2 n=1 Tax=Hemicordylus capensis TaxID=884348 RepID=UPI0023032A10|nr:CMP-N-acetylneuraminate-beta-galactosamide-alpha-2,3-sialyltransferase 2-like isoform X2 [Hemicordylus capensis]